MARAWHLCTSLPLDELAAAWAPEAGMGAERLCGRLLAGALGGAFDRVADPESGMIRPGVLYRDRYGHLRSKDHRLLRDLFALIAATEQPERFTPAVAPALSAFRQLDWARRRPSVLRVAAANVHILQLTRPAAFAYARPNGLPVPSFWQRPPPRSPAASLTAGAVQQFLNGFPRGSLDEDSARAAVKDHFGVDTIPERSVWQPAWRALDPARKRGQDRLGPRNRAVARRLLARLRARRRPTDGYAPALDDSGP